MPKYHVTTKRAVIHHDVRIIIVWATVRLTDGWSCLLVQFVPINMWQASIWYYYYFVPMCKIITNSTPSKRLISEPKIKTIRRQWGVSARRDFPMREHYLRYYFISLPECSRELRFVFFFLHYMMHSEMVFLITFPL